MAYDLLIKNGRIVDGSGMPAFHGDVGGQGRQDRRDRQIVAARPAQTVDAGGQVVAPGFIDNHCHYDAQVTWDPLCSFSLRPRRDQRRHRQLLAVPGAGAPGQRKADGRVPLLCRSDPDGGAQHRRGRLGNVPAIHGPARPAISASMSAR